MRETELFLNTLNNRIRQAVLWVGESYTAKKLGELLNRTNLESLVITGSLTRNAGEKMLSELLHRARTGRQRVPDSLSYCLPEDLRRPQGEFALLFADLECNSDILALRELEPEYLIGEVKSVGISAFGLWESFRSCCRHIYLLTLPEGDSNPKALDWEREEGNDVELSVILPMYNVAKYLDQCIGTVCAWKADYVEFLFVDDGSPDNSGDIVRSCAEKDTRIKLLEKPNGGCASARQWGLDRAKGRYVGFVDPDDFIDESMFRKLLCAAMCGSYDISYCGYKEYYENNGQTMDAPDTIGWPYSSGVTEARQVQPLITYARVAIWRGIYKKAMLEKNGIHFYTDLRRFDDLPFKVETFAAAQSVIAVEEYLYYYRLARPGQDVAADDERLYVHFPIFEHLNESVAARKDQRLIDYLQLCKIQTHRYAMGKIRPEFLREYVRRARKDLNSTGKFFRTLSLAWKMIGKKSTAIYFATMTGNLPLLIKLCKN